MQPAEIVAVPNVPGPSTAAPFGGLGGGGSDTAAAPADEADASAITRAEHAAPEPFLAAEARLAQVGIFLIMLIAALYFSKDFLLPVSLAFLSALVLSPAVRGLRRRGVPEFVSAAALVVILIAAVSSAVWVLIDPVQQFINDVPSTAATLRDKISLLRGPIERVMAASQRMEEAARAGLPVQRVVLEEPGLLSRAATGVPEIGAKLGLTIVLLLFLLASGDMFYEKLVKVLPTLSDKKRGVRITREVEREVSRYLFTITIINIALGIAIGIAMSVVGMPTPVLWGILGGVLNYMPYIGPALTGSAIVVVALVSFDTVGAAMVAPAVFFAITVFEGQIVTPMLVGRRLEMNPVAIFLAVAFWGWLWGIAGAIMAVPILVVVKIFSDHVDGYAAISEFLGAREGHVAKEKDAAAEKQ